jgi:CRP/FNR family transcriptional regulator, nitrogen oxide reductase regulator
MPNRPSFRKRVSPTPTDSGPEFVPPGAFDDPHQLIAALFRSRTIGLGIIDRDLRFTAVNKALAAMHGLPVRAHPGKTLREVLGDAAKALEPVIRRNFASGQFASAWRLSRLLGQERKVEILDRFPLKGEGGTIEQIAYVVVRIPVGGNWEQRLGRGLAVHEQRPCKTFRLMVQPEPMPRFALSAALFQGLDSEEVDSVLNAAQIRKVKPGEYLCRQGERTNKLYLLKTGLIKVNSTTDTGKEVLLRWVRPGEVFGLGSLTKSPLRNVWSALAVEPSETLEWDKTTIQRLSTLYPAFWPNAMWIALRWAHELQTRVEQMATERVEQRLARIVIDLSRQVSSTTQPVELHVSEEELAQIVGTTLFTINKVLSRWKRRGYVQTGRKRLLILNREILSRVANGLMDSLVAMPRAAAIRKHRQSAATA